MMAWVGRLSLGKRMVGLFGALWLANGIFMLAFWPARMADRARVSAEQRANAIARVMSTALGPALEFDDTDNAGDILAWLATTPDARFGVVDRENGSRLAVWHAEAVPAHLAWSAHARSTTRGDLLIVSVPIVGLGGGQGTLHAGFSLHALADERAHIRRTVAETTMAVFVTGVLATLVLATLLVRPIRRLTNTARLIARGELPPHLPVPEGADEVAQMAESLSVMLERLNQVNRELQRASRHAGMAEVATGVLHNVGNVLTSVNVAVELMHDRTRDLPVERLRKLGDLLAAGPLDAERRAAAIRYVGVVGDLLARGRDESMRALDGLRGHLDHVKSVVAMQNAYARPGGVAETAAIDALVDEAIELGGVRGTVAVTVHAPSRRVSLDRHRVLQIIVNLISNARDAVAAAPLASIAISAAVTDGRLRIEVADTGTGIAADALDRIFGAGFTTKPRGHGYGLHSAALAARQLGGELTAASDGPGRGATFTLTIPVTDAG